MARQKKVVDASVLVKWFANEPGSDEALELRREHLEGKTLLVVPELALTESINAMRYKEPDARLLNEVNETLWNVQLHSERINKTLLDRAVLLALKYKLSVYDATYLAVAEMFGAPLYTADEALAHCPNTIKIPNKSRN